MAKDNKKTLHIKKQDLKEVGIGKKENEKEILIDIKIEKDNQELNFEKLEKGILSNDDIEIEWRKHGDEKDKTYKKLKTKILYDGGWFKHSFKLPKDLTFGSDKSEKPSDQTIATDKHSFKPMAYVTLVVLLMIVGGLIWWWFSSSKKEDKEEESI